MPRVSLERERFGRHRLREVIAMRQLERTSIRGMLFGVLFAVSLAVPARIANGLDGDQRAEIRRALEAAQVALEDNSIAAARFWADRASALLTDAASSHAKTYPLGNASQLLEVLAIYTYVADGRNADLDAEAAWLIAQLETIRWLDEGRDKPHRLGERLIDYAPFTNLVRRVGDLWIDRNPFTQQIRRIGDISIDYEPFTLEPRRIGGITVSYHPFTGQLQSIAGVSVH